MKQKETNILLIIIIILLSLYIIHLLYSFKENFQNSYDYEVVPECPYGYIAKQVSKGVYSCSPIR